MLNKEFTRSVKKVKFLIDLIFFVFGNFVNSFTETLPLTWICDETEKLSRLAIAEISIIDDKIPGSKFIKTNKA